MFMQHGQNQLLLLFTKNRLTSNEYALLFYLKEPNKCVRCCLAMTTIVCAGLYSFFYYT